MDVLSPEAQEIHEHLVAFQAAGDCSAWYKPANHERAGDRITKAWLARYRARHPADWDRMLEHLRGYKVWAEKTAEDRAKRTGSFRRHEISALLSRIGEGQRSLEWGLRLRFACWVLFLLASDSGKNFTEELRDD